MALFARRSCSTSEEMLLLTFNAEELLVQCCESLVFAGMELSLPDAPEQWDQRPHLHR